MKPNIWSALLVVAIILLIIDYQRGCNETKIDPKEQKKIREENDSLKKKLDDYLVVNDSLLNAITTKDSNIRYMATQLVDKTKQLNNSKVVIVGLREELRDWREKDTGYVYPRFDSLLNEIDKMVVAIDGYQGLINQLSKEIQDQKDNYESLAAKRAQIIADLRSSYNNVYATSRRLFNDNTKLESKLKTEKIKFRVSALLAIAEGILLSLK